MKIAFYTLGCKLNQSETYSMANDLQAKGHIIVKLEEHPEVCIINTCTVTSHSDQRCRQMIRRIATDNPTAFIIVTGCYAQRHADEIKNITGVNLVVGNNEKSKINNFVNDLNKSSTRAEVTEIKNEIFLSNCGTIGKTRAFIKIQDGCDSSCSYCIVPQVRGKNRSVPMSKILDEINKSISLGYKEIVLTGIHIGTYGRDQNNAFNLAKLLKEIVNDRLPIRIRLSSIEPDEVTDELLEIVSTSNLLCKHLHIPLQSGSNEILKMMNRNYTVEKFKILIEKTINQCKNIALGTDLIVGFPGETKNQFNESYHFIQSLPLSYIHVFPYSKREGTRAGDLKDNVSSEEKKERVNIIKEIVHQKNINYKKQFINTIVSVLVENTRNKTNNMLVGLTDNYLKVLFNGDDSLMKSFVLVKITELKNDVLIGEIIEDKSKG